MMTTSDKELLELAAKAAGIELNWGVDLFSFYMDAGETIPWNPLTDDGDALRLAVKLKKEVYHGNDEGEAVYASYANGNNFAIEYYDDLLYKGDPYAATRRAIVRAAAKRGESM